MIVSYLCHHRHCRRPLRLFLHVSTRNSKLTFSEILPTVDPTHPSDCLHGLMTHCTPALLAAKSNKGYIILWLLNSFSSSFPHYPFISICGYRLNWIPAGFWSHVKYLHFYFTLHYFITHTLRVNSFVMRCAPPLLGDRITHSTQSVCLSVRLSVSNMLLTWERDSR